MLKFEINRFTITKTADPSPASDNIDHLTASFSFTDDWTEQPFAIFKGSGACIKQMIVDGQCVVPWEVLADPGYVYVSCFAGQRITSNIVSFYVNASGYCEADNEHEPTPEVYEQLIAYFDSVKADIEDITEQAVSDMTEIKDQAITEVTALKDDAEDAADRAEQAAGQAGYMFFFIDDRGHLIYERTPNVNVDFSLGDDGHLYVEAIG